MQCSSRGPRAFCSIGAMDLAPLSFSCRDFLLIGIHASFRLIIVIQPHVWAILIVVKPPVVGPIVLSVIFVIESAVVIAAALLRGRRPTDVLETALIPARATAILELAALLRKVHGTRVAPRNKPAEWRCEFPSTCM